MESDRFQVVVAAFTGEAGADGAHRRIKEIGIPRGNVAIIKRDQTGRLSLSETHDWGMGKSALVGAVAAILLPGIGPLLGAAIGAGAAYLIDAGFPDESLKRMGAGLTPNSSAIVVLVDEADRARIEQALLDAGGQVVSGGLDANLAARASAVAEGLPGELPPAA